MCLMTFDDILAERQAQDRPKTGQDSLETGARQAKMCPRQAPDRLQVAELMAEGEQLSLKCLENVATPATRRLFKE